MGLIFISYRRSDAAGHAGRLFDRLSNWFDSKALFFDRESIDGGENFTRRIEDEIRGAKVVLAVIAPEWLDDANRKRLHRDDDMVRRELALALAPQKDGNKPVVIPVLCGGAKMPAKAGLPEDIQALCALHAHTIDDAGYGPSFDKILVLLKTHGLAPFIHFQHGDQQPFHTNGQRVSPYFADPLRKLDALYRTLHQSGTALVATAPACAESAVATTLHHSGTALVATAVHGMGGAGKTQLALKYSEAFRDEYDGVWWFRSDDALQLEEDCQELCAEFNVERRGDEAHSAAVRRWLKKGVGRWLLVYDNADNPDKVRALLPEAGKHHVIYTSRSPHWSGTIRKGEMVAMESWTVDQSLEFLNIRLPEADAGRLRLLASTLGGLPLALEQACAYVDRTGVTVETYCRRVQELLDTSAPDTGYPHSVLATLSLAFGQLSDAAKELLRLCAWGAPEPIPEMIFRRAGTLLPEAMRLVAVDDLLWVKVVAELTDFAVAQRVEIDLTRSGSKERQADRALLLHRLSQMVAIHCLSNASKDAKSFTKLVRSVFPSDLNSPSGWPLAKALAPHVLRLEEQFASGKVPHREISWLLDRLATYLQLGPALYDQSLAIFRRALVLDETILGADHKDTLASMGNLATMLRSMGDNPGAKELQEQVLERKKEVFGPDHPDTLITMGNLALTLSSMGDNQGAKALEEQVLERRKAVLGPDHPNTLASMNNLASTLRNMGVNQRAKALEEQALERRKAVLGPDHPDTLTSMNNLALTLWSMGDNQGAKELEEQVLERRKAVLGPDHPDTLTSMSNLAGTLRTMGDNQGAKALEEQVLERIKEVLGPRHPDTTIAAWNHFLTLEAINDSEVSHTVIHEHLLWLLDDGVELHSADQRQIRDMLRGAVASK